MELIKQIKEAEAQAKEIVEQAKVDAAAIGEDSRARQAEQMDIAREERKQAIERAVGEAEAAGQSEVEGLKAQAAEEKQQLQAGARARIDSCAGRVMDYLRQM
jgi:F0F1-type ATP synthase membrane subunit b/b'